MNNGKHGQGTHCSKMGADKLAENTLNAPKFICPNFLPKPKSLGFRWKRLHWVSVVRGSTQTYDGKICNEIPKMATCCTIETQWEICHEIFSFSWNNFHFQEIWTKFFHFHEIYSSESFKILFAEYLQKKSFNVLKNLKKDF